MQKYLLILVCIFSLLISPIAKGQNQNCKWELQSPLPTGNHINDVYFVDNQTGWAVTADGVILHTSNGGASWQTQTIGKLKQAACKSD
jgi:hypothetical protein